jgi:large subunit ribosomal protein L35
MPKMKTKSGAKKRFSITSSGIIKHACAYKRHGMRKRPQKMKRTSRGATALDSCEFTRVKKYFLPNGA